MKDLFIKLSVMVEMLKDENGQDLIEYALVVAFVAFAATAGMKVLADRYQRCFYYHWQRSNRRHRLIIGEGRVNATNATLSFLGRDARSRST